MRRGVAVLAVALLALAGATAVSPAATPAVATNASADGGVNTTASTAPPTTNVTLNGEPVSDGEFRVLRNETTAVLRARISADDGRSLDTVLVQVGGENVVDVDDPGQSVRINRTLPIGPGNNSVRVVAEDSREQLTTRGFRLYLERVPPAMDLERPVDTVPDPFEYEPIVTNRSRVVFAGRFRDLTGFREAVVSFRDPGSDDVFQSFAVRRGPTFREEVLLPYGRSNVRVAATDTLGNDHLVTVPARVVDERAPGIDLGVDRTPLETPRYNVSATVTDNVWVENVSVTVHHLGRTPYQEYNRQYEPVDRRLYEHSGDRLSTDFDESVRLVQGRNVISITARDHLGHAEYRSFEVGYFPETERPPSADFLRNATRIEGNESAAISAVVTDANNDLRRVIVEVESLDRRQLTDVESYRFDNESTFLFEDRLNITAGVSEVELLAVDGAGNRTTERLFIDTREGRQSLSPPAGYAEVANESETPAPPAETTPEQSTPSGTTTATSPAESPTAAPTDGGGTTESIEGGNTTATAGGSAGTGDRGGPFSGLTSVPVLAAFVLALVGGGYYGWVKLTRV